MKSTQEHLPIADIKNDLVILKDGSFSLVLETSAVNFDLLSENEQMAIIYAFAGMLNSLSFSIQIVIRSKKLDISSYLKTLSSAQSRQPNPLLKQMIGSYYNFISSLITDNQVLDKQFFVVITVSYYELGLVNNQAKNLEKAMTILSPRRDHIIKQLSRIGLKSSQLSTEKLTRLFFDLYNEDLSEPVQVVIAPQQSQEETKQVAPAPVEIPQPNVIQQPAVIQSPSPPPQAPITQIIQPVVQNVAPIASEPPRRNTAPFVTEEVSDDFGYAR